MCSTHWCRAMRRHAAAFELIIDTIPVNHPLIPYIPLLDFTGTLVTVGALGMARTSYVKMTGEI